MENVMISDDDLDDEPASERDDWQQLAPGVRRLSLPGNAPVRKILTGHRDREVGAFWSYKMHQHMAHESEDWESRAIKLHEVRVLVEQYFTQAEKLEIRVYGEQIKENGREIVTYTLDTLTVLRGLEVRFEVKPFSKLQPKRKLDPSHARSVYEHDRARKLRRKLRMVRQAYRNAGLLWLLLTEREMDAMSDPKTVDDIIANGGRDIDPDDFARLRFELSRVPGRRLPLGQCEALVCASEFPRGAILARIPERVLSMSLVDPITAESLIKLEEIGDE
jgi:hypothetical protein